MRGAVFETNGSCGIAALNGPCQGELEVRLGVEERTLLGEQSKNLDELVFVHAALLAVSHRSIMLS